MEQQPEQTEGTSAVEPAATATPQQTSTSAANSLRRAMLDKLFSMQARFPDIATRHDWYLALSYAVRQRLLHKWIDTVETYFRRESRTVVYLSAEFLMGPQLGCNLMGLGLVEAARKAVAQLGVDLDLEDLLEEEEEPGLGNGGLGRLAACFMDSLATLGVPAIGHGIRYEFGIFDQTIQDGWQVEIADTWLRYGNPWEIARPQVAFDVKLGGRTEAYVDASGKYRVRWIPDRIVKGTPFDTPVAGYGVRNVNLLRLWTARASESFDFQAFNAGDYYGAVDQKVESENLTKVLYPNDEPISGKILRLEQQYFFVSCALQDLVRLHLQRQKTLDGFHQKWAIQLNDTHPSIAVAELMRLLIDEHDMEWEKAWDITTRSFGYTNHTLLPEALETWPLPLFSQVLPRHLEVIFEINRRFLNEVWARFPGDEDRAQRLSLIDEHGAKRVRMANLACVGSHAINGVAALHTELLQATVLKDFHDLWPEKFSNKTNGVSPRRFLMEANPALTALLTEAIGEDWKRDLEAIGALEPFAEDGAFREAWRRVKRENKARLAGAMQARTMIPSDPDSLFDIQVKRIHEYKRQHLNVLHLITLYARLLEDPGKDQVPRTLVFAGKAAPGYFMAKRIIKLIHAVGDVVNNDPRVADRLRVIFYPDFNVKSARRVYPAADLSEQISTAGKEASGTGNMKFAMNGALTIGTLDGANVEIRQEVGEENFFLFGLTAEEVASKRQQGYRPWEEIEHDEELQHALALLESGHFSGGDRSLFEPLVRSLREQDEYFLMADYRAYVDCQERVSRAFADPESWARMSILNVARMGRFSSDRSIREYCEEIWQAGPVHVPRSEAGERAAGLLVRA